MKIVGHSHEDPRRWWLAFGFGQITFYRFGVELYLGTSRHFLFAGLGTDECAFYWVGSP